MKSAAIVIDTWKLDVFKKHLFRHEFIFQELPGVAEDTLTLKVVYWPWPYSIRALQDTITGAMMECRRLRPSVMAPHRTVQ